MPPTGAVREILTPGDEAERVWSLDRDRGDEAGEIEGDTEGDSDGDAEAYPRDP